MPKTKLTILPVRTFERLGVNDTERDIRRMETENIIVPDSENQVIVQYKETDTETNIVLEQNAGLKLIQIFDRKTQTVSKLKANLAENAKLNLFQLYLGSDTVSEIITELNGENAFFSAEIGYDLKEDDQLDINLIANHHGRKSVSDISVSGVLRENARKIFKGTIDFKHGSVGAAGNEKEDVILLSKNVRNKTVPIILCAEEDVIGNHGATIGRIDERHIFYMKSRGIPEKKAYELIAKSKLMKVIEQIDNEQVKKHIYGSLMWGDYLE